MLALRTAERMLSASGCVIRWRANKTELGPHDRGKHHGYRVHRIDVDGGSDRGKARTVNESVDMVCRGIRAPRSFGGMGASRQTGAKPRWCQRTLTARAERCET